MRIFLGAAGIFSVFVSTSVLHAEVKCQKGYQPYADRCVSQRMADYISCVEASGGNRQEISEAVTSEGTKQTSVKGEVKGKGVVVEGSGKLALDLSSEKNLVQKFEQRWFPAG
jgi:hypothetical protein